MAHRELGAGEIGVYRQDGLLRQRIVVATLEACQNGVNERLGHWLGVLR